MGRTKKVEDFEVNEFDEQVNTDDGEDQIDDEEFNKYDEEVNTDDGEDQIDDEEFNKYDEEVSINDEDDFKDDEEISVNDEEVNVDDEEVNKEAHGDGLTLEQIKELQYEPELGVATQHWNSEEDNVVIDNSLDITYREDWCDEPPVSVSPTTSIPTLVRIMHTFGRKKIKTKEESVELLREIFEIQAQNFNQGYRDIRYNFAIGAEGEIYECRGWNVKPEVLPYPTDNTEERVDIAYLGNYAHKTPPFVMMEAAISLIQYGIKNLYLHPACKVKHLDHALRFKTEKAYRNITELLES